MLTPRALAAGLSDEARCRSVVLFAQLTVGILLPVLTVAMARLPRRQRKLQRKAARHGGAAAKAYAAADRGLRRALGRKLAPPLRLMLHATWLSGCWVASQ